MPLCGIYAMLSKRNISDIILLYKGKIYLNIYVSNVYFEMILLYGPENILSAYCRILLLKQHASIKNLLSFDLFFMIFRINN